MSEIVDKNLQQELAKSDAQALAELDAPEQAPSPEPTKEETPPAEPEKTEPEKVENQEEATKAPEDEIKPRPHARQETHKDFDALKGIIKDERKQREEVEKKAKELEDKLSSLEREYKDKTITPEIEKDLEDYRELRRTFQIENDPEFRQKYDTKLKDIDGRALGILKSERMSPQVEKFILDSGGIVAMYGSTQQMPRPYQDQTYREFIEETLMGKLTGISKTRFEQALASAMDLKDEMSREIEQAKLKGSERQKEKQKQLEELFKSSAEATRKSFGKMAEKMEYPKDASKEDKVKIDQHNDRVKKAEQAFSDYMKTGNDPAKLAEMMARAAHSQLVLEEMQEKEAEIEAHAKKIKDLEEKIEKMKKSGETGRSTAAPPVTNQPPQQGKFLSDAQALEQAFPGKQ